MIDAASAQLAELIEELSLAARIESGRYDPTPRAANTLELAQAAAARLGEERVHVTGSGAELETDTVAVERGLAALFQSALRHGGLDEVAVEVDGREIRLSRVTAASAPVVLGEDLRDLGAVGGRRRAVDEPLRHRRRPAAAVADGLQLVDELGAAEQLRHRPEREAAEVLVEPAGDDPHPALHEAVEDERDLRREELDL